MLHIPSSMDVAPLYGFVAHMHEVFQDVWNINMLCFDTYPSLRHKTKGFISVNVFFI